MYKTLISNFIILLCLSIIPAQAVVKLDITGGQVQPLPIAISPFYNKNAATGQMGYELAQIINANLSGSGLFKVVPTDTYPQNPEQLQLAPNFFAWQTTPAQALVTGSAELESNGMIRIEFRLWDIVSGEQIPVGKALTAPISMLRRVSHQISDIVYKALTGEEGYFDTRIVYVAESGRADNIVRQLAIMDQDGANHKFLTNQKSDFASPRFSPNGQDITYVRYDNRKPRIHMMNVLSGKHETLTNTKGISFGSSFSPTAQDIAFSVAMGGNTDMYLLNLPTRRLQQLTFDPNSETVPSFSPDGTKIVFESDRTTTQQLYVMNATGGEATRITFGKGRYAAPQWSPRGDLIAFTRMSQGRFFVGTIRPDGSDERILVEDFDVESPSWAPNGRVLVYYRQSPMDRQGNYTARLYARDIAGFYEREIVTPTNAVDPTWSPKLRY